MDGRNYTPVVMVVGISYGDRISGKRAQDRRRQMNYEV